MSRPTIMSILSICVGHFVLFGMMPSSCYCCNSKICLGMYVEPVPASPEHKANNETRHLFDSSISHLSPSLLSPTLSPTLSSTLSFRQVCHHPFRLFITYMFQSSSITHKLSLPRTHPNVMKGSSHKRNCWFLPDLHIFDYVLKGPSTPQT